MKMNKLTTFVLAAATCVATGCGKGGEAQPQQNTGPTGPTGTTTTTTVTPVSINATAGTVSYDEVNKKLIATDVGNELQQEIKTGVGVNVKTELDGASGTVTNNKNGTLRLKVSGTNTILKYFVQDANGATTAEYDLKFANGATLDMYGASGKSFTDNGVYDAAYYTSALNASNQTVTQKPQ